MSSMEKRLESTVEEADGNNINVPTTSPTQFSSELVSHVFSSGDFQRNLFDTPPSLLSSPQFDMFSPFRGQGSRRERCNFCTKEMKSSQSTTFSCSHKICSGCSALTEGRKCVVCMSPSSASQLPSMFLSPNMTADNNTSGCESYLGDISLCSSSNTSYQNVNGISNALQNMSLGLGEIREESFNIWDNSKINLTPNAYDANTDEHPVFSPLDRMGSQLTFPTGKSVMVACAACGSKTSAVGYCANCVEFLCDGCVEAHQRVRMTKDHKVVAIESLFSHFATPTKEMAGSGGSISGAGTSDNSSPRPTSVCGIHEALAICSCGTCGGTGLCHECLPLHYKHKICKPVDIRSALSNVVSYSRQRDIQIDEALNGVFRMVERVDASSQSVASELRSAIHLHMGAIEERKRELLQKLETIRQDKLTGLKNQEIALHSSKQALATLLKTYDDCDKDEESTQLQVLYDQLLQFYSQPTPLQIQEVDMLKFNIPEENQLLSKVRSLGELMSGPCPRTSTFKGESFRNAIRDRQSVVYVQLRDACGDVTTMNCMNQLAASLLAPDGHLIDVHIADQGNGIYALSYYPLQDGRHLLNIVIRGVPIVGCPLEIEVRRGRNYADIAMQGELFSFGKEGSGDGELCRPWGICIDHRGRVLVADRSNNRIQIFDREGTFLDKFGAGGTRAGKFDRPAGITVNTMNNIIVADKDNHRIQVFDENGTFMLKFGERGRQTGMFNYPWGVATNSQNHIAVSDTRNHRVQIFDCNGQFIRKCGFENAFFYKHLDSPRGLCYLPDGQLLITDFNNHRLAVLSSRNSPEMKVYGSEGEVKGMFCRPQGVKVDAEGHILVCDSRNNRIQVFAGEDMRCVAVFGHSTSTSGSSGFQMPQELPVPYQAAAPTMPFMGGGPFLAPTKGAAPQPPPALLDRPTDLAVSPDGRVYVVDFGNNCVRVF